MTEPLGPSEVNLRGLPWMRLDTTRLLDSDLFALSTGDEFKAAVALWCKSWTQLPAGSLPNDERVLAHLSGAGSRWKKVRAMALRGWVLCEDGRLYHPIVAEQATAAWDERVEYRADNDARNERKQRERAERSAMFERLKTAGYALAWNTPTGKLRELIAALPAEPVTPEHVTGGVTGHRRATVGVQRAQERAWLRDGREVTLLHGLERAVQIRNRVALGALGGDGVAHHLAALLDGAVRGLVGAAFLDAPRDRQEVGRLERVRVAAADPGKNVIVEIGDNLSSDSCRPISVSPSIPRRSP